MSVEPAGPDPVAADPGSPGGEPLVEMTGITVEFSGVRALDGVDFRLFPGEIHALMGENGAGKSTLIKSLTGVNRVVAGITRLAGSPVGFSTPRQAQDAGIATVYQEVNLCTNLTVAENVLLGREPRRFGSIDHRATRRRAGELLHRIGVRIDPASLLGEHPIAVQQLVAITRAVAVDARVLILDEPTSSLDADEVAELFRIMRILRDEGVAILFVSHFLEQVYAVSDRMTVLRNGRLVTERLTRDLPRMELLSAMMGRQVSALAEVEKLAARLDPVEEGVPALRVRGLGRRRVLEPIDLDVRPGEVVGLAGLLGSGRTELARLLTGADRADSGTVEVDGRPVRLVNPRVAAAAGIAFCSEDRKAEGVVGDLSVRDNLVLALQAARGWSRPLPRRVADQHVATWIQRLDIRPPRADVALKDLSGGNQQKVLLARRLVTEPRILVLDEPTRGIDVGAKAEIQRLVAELAAAGLAVVFISAELEEVLRVSHRVVVLKDRRKLAELPGGCGVDDVMRLIAATSTDPADRPDPTELPTGSAILPSSEVTS